MRTTRKHASLGLLAGTLAMGLGLAAQAAVTRIADSFSLNGTTRVEGAALGGQITEVGGAIWKTVDGNFCFNAAGAVQANESTNWTAPQSSVALPAATGVVTLTVDANPYNTCDSAYWCGLGFLSGDTAGWWSDPNGAPQLWAYLKNDGNWSFQYNGWTGLGSGDMGSTGTGFHALSISYDPATKKAKFSIDGVTKVDWISLGAFIPSLGAASIKNSGAPPTSYEAIEQFDNFVVTVPEPASLGLLLLAGGLLAGRRRHRN